MPRPSIGVGVLVWRDGKLLLGKRINKDKSTCWQFPGGHLESYESVTQCATREVMEETGLEVNRIRHLGFTDKPFVIESRQYITLLVSGDYVSGELETREPEKCEAWQWFDYPDLPSPLFLPITSFIAQQGDLYALHRTAAVMLDKPLDTHR